MTGSPDLRVVPGSGPKPDAVPRALELAAVGTGLTLTAALMARLPAWFQNLGTFQLLYAASFAFYALAVARLPRWSRLPGAGVAVLAVALAARAALLPAAPSLSGDVYRYVWEGRVVAHGADPYRLPPSDPALAGLRDDVVWPRINHPELAAIYPPLALAGFALVSRVSDTVAAFKLWVVLHDLALIAVLLAWTARSPLGPAVALVYAWNPLLLIEHAGSGHNEPTSLLWLVVALVLAERRPLASALALATGALVKLLPVLALPILWRRWPWRARLTALALTVGGFAFYLHRARGERSGLFAYWERWRNNELAFHALERMTGSFPVARALALLAVVVAIAWAVRRGSSAARGTQVALRTATLVAPVIHPWYLAWTLAFEPWTRSAPWLLLSLLVILNYGVLAMPPEGRDHHPSLAVRAVEYGLPLALAAGLAVRARLAARRNEIAKRERA